MSEQKVKSGQKFSVACNNRHLLKRALYDIFIEGIFVNIFTLTQFFLNYKNGMLQGYCGTLRPTFILAMIL